MEKKCSILACATGSIFQKIANIEGIVSALKDGFYKVLIEKRSPYVEAYPVTGDIGNFPAKVYVVISREMLDNNIIRFLFFLTSTKYSDSLIKDTKYKILLAAFYMMAIMALWNSRYLIVQWKRCWKEL